jgi:predicted amidohydrolase
VKQHMWLTFFITIILVGSIIAVAGEDKNKTIHISGAQVFPYRTPCQLFIWSPAEHLSPEFRIKDNVLILRSKGTDNCIGKWAIEQSDLTPGKWYRIGVSYKTENIADPDQSVIGVLSWFDAERRPKQQDYMLEAGQSGEWHRIERILQMPEDASLLEIGLYLRWAKTGSVLYRNVTIEPAQAPKPRLVKLAVINYKPRDASTPEESINQLTGYLNQAGELDADIVCFGEVIDQAGTNLSALETASPLTGRNTRILREFARKYKMYLVGSVYIEENNSIYNMGILINRLGEITGTFKKVHLPFAETLSGVMPGNEFPVFDTDFGKIGIEICYDNFFPESARCLALNGAEVIFLPIWGDGRWDFSAWEVVSRTRAIDNSVYFVASMYGQRRSVIIDPTGKVLQDGKDKEGIYIAEVDLNATTRTNWLSVKGRGEWKNLFKKERRPKAYQSIYSNSEKK